MLIEIKILRAIKVKRLVTVLVVCLVLVLGECPVAADSDAIVKELRCEYGVNPLGVDVVSPRLSWIIESQQRGWKQSSYQVIVSDGEEKLKHNSGNLWDSGKIESNQSVHVVYTGKPLSSRMRCYWKVRVWDECGKVTAWSEPAMWSMGLLKASDWKGKWIGLDRVTYGSDIENSQWIWSAGKPAGTRFFRRTLKLPTEKEIEDAQCVITADNEFTLLVNGVRAGSGDDFNHRAVEFDLTSYLHAGSNVLAVAAKKNGDANNPAGLIAALRVEFDRGEPLLIITDKKWLVSNRKEPGWEGCVFDDSSWEAAQEIGEFGTRPWDYIWRSIESESVYRRLPARIMRREFQVTKKLERAIAYVCGLGYYELYINGQKIGDCVLDPAMTDYSKRPLYVTYDVTDQLNQGANAAGVILGNGRYFAPRMNTPGAINRTYGFPKLLLQMCIEYDDGTTLELVSDERWKVTADGPIRANNDYDGEHYDARLEQDGWCRAGFDDSGWQKVHLVTEHGWRQGGFYGISHLDPNLETVRRVGELKGALRSQMIEPIRITGTVKPVAITNPRDGIYVYDMGQNMVGWVRLKVAGPRGTKVVLRFAERLGDDGTLDMENLHGAKATDVYVLKGKGVEVYEPRFTYHGFRYVEIKGFPGEPDLSTIEGKVVHTSAERVGSFCCSNTLINRIYNNILWTVRGNLRSIPTDCPQRAERQGWLGDIANESKAQSYDFNVARFYIKWLKDIQDAQKDNGEIPNVVPAYWVEYHPNLSWPSTYIIIPGWFFEQYGDTRILETHYPSMKKWIEFISTFLKDYTMPLDRYGDHCVPTQTREMVPNRRRDLARQTNGEVIGTAYFYHGLCLMSRYAEILGKSNDAKQFKKLSEKVKQAFNKKFLNKETNLYDNGTQTSSILPLAFGMVPDEHRQGVFNNLVDNIMAKNNGHLCTGLVGCQWLMRVLSDNGRPDVAYTLASQKTYPSWGYMIEKGATTIWELWNGDTAKSRTNQHGYLEYMNSHNHLMLVGDLGIWLYEYLAGIKCDPEGPGFKKIIIKPHVVGDLSWVRASYNSIHGKIASEWCFEYRKFQLNVTVPANTTATVYVPAENADCVTESGKPANESDGVRLLSMESGNAVFAIGSGKYRFISSLSQ